MRVQWLNGDLEETVDTSAEDVHILGPRNDEPPPIRTKQEEWEIHEQGRANDKDPHLKAKEQLQSKVDGVSGVCLC